MKHFKNYLNRIKLYIKKQGKKIKSLTKTLIDVLNPHSSLIVAIATVILAIITGLHIGEARKMRLETKRLADISVEQFKIRAYPAFIVSPKISLESDELIQTFKIFLRGEIAAQKLTTQLIHVHSIGGKNLFNASDISIYEGKNALELENTLLPNADLKLETRITLSGNYSIKTLKNLLFFIRFWVPYDDKYSYEVFGYALETTEAGCHWEKITREDTNDLIRQLKDKNFKRIDFKAGTRIENFFEDYNYDLDL